MPFAQSSKIPNRGLGWKPGKGTNPGAYPMRSLINQKLNRAPEDLPTSRAWWANGWWGDQGNSSECTIYSWLHLIHDGPVTHALEAKPLANLTQLYQEGQTIDGTPHSDVYSGLTCDAAAKVIRRHGWITAYHWANSVEDVITALRGVGPVTIGMWWKSEMFDPDENGVIRYKGSDEGGHQVLLNGVSARREMVRIKNSWGRGWGLRGHAYMTFDDLGRALEEQGEACLAAEIRPAGK